MRKVEARPGLGGGGRPRTAAVANDHHDCSTWGQPVALAVVKRGRVCVVAKVTFLDGDPILAIAHRGQHGVDSTISIPVAALNYAQNAGCGWFYFRRDQSGDMYRLPLADLPRLG